MFGIFSLAIANYRRQPNSIDCGPLDTFVSPEFLVTRTFSSSWSVWLGWVGVGFCFLSAFTVYILSKLMRNITFLA